MGGLGTGFPMHDVLRLSLPAGPPPTFLARVCRPGPCLNIRGAREHEKSIEIGDTLLGARRCACFLYREKNLQYLSSGSQMTLAAKLDSVIVSTAALKRYAMSIWLGWRYHCCLPKLLVPSPADYCMRKRPWLRDARVHAHDCTRAQSTTEDAHGGIVVICAVLRDAR